MTYLKIILACVLRFVLHIFWIFPIKKNTIFFVSYSGTQYSCNPKYIFEFLYKKYNTSLEYVWMIHTAGDFPSEYKNVTLVKKKNILAYIFYIMTSKVYISNNASPGFIPYRKEQVIINTWHGGGAYKQIGVIQADINDKHYIKHVMHYNAKVLTYFISSCTRFTKAVAASMFISEEKFLPIGMPRNDIYFRVDENKQKEIKQKLQIAENYKIVLYAPTYREAHKGIFSGTDIDVDRLLHNLKKRFNVDFLFLFRSHYFVNTMTTQAHGLNVSDYPDMQELLYITDVLITDYSSCMWDFSFLHKPCFVYVPDLNSYKMERDFYTPIEKWAFPFAVSNDELEQRILSFSEAQNSERIKNHHNELGSYENGTATEDICTVIYNHIINLKSNNENNL